MVTRTTNRTSSYEARRAAHHGHPDATRTADILAEARLKKYQLIGRTPMVRMLATRAINQLAARDADRNQQ